MSRAFIFPGQGSQAIGMGRELAEAYPAARAVFDEVDDALGAKLSALIWEGDAETLTLTENAQPALYLFEGEVYTGLDGYALDKASVEYVNAHVGILSGLYGVLKPLDLIQPYRLEMGTALENPKGKNLYTFWDDAITQVVNERVQAVQGDEDKPVLVNLASNEYFKAIKKAALRAQVITPRFEDEKNGAYKVISFYAKKARGLMVKYAAENHITDAEGLKGFDLAGYYYCEAASDAKTWTFRRDAADQ